MQVEPDGRSPGPRRPRRVHTSSSSFPPKNDSTQKSNPRVTGSGDTVNQGKIYPQLPQVRRKLGDQDQDTLHINDIVYIKLMMQCGMRRDISVTFMNKLVPAAMMYAKSHDANATNRGNAVPD